MSDHKEAYASRTFKKDQYAWVFLIFLVLIFFKATDRWRETDHATFRSWKGPLSNQATVTVLQFDRVVGGENEGHVPEDTLRQQLKALDEDGFEAVSIKDVYNFYYKDGKLPEKSLLLIFANGYLETYSVVDPILRAMKWPAAVSLITDPIVRRDTFFLYWDRLRHMVGSGIWDIVSAGHRRRQGMTNVSKLMNGFFTLKIGAVKDEREEAGPEHPASIFQDYQISRGLIEEHIAGYKTLAYSHRHLKNASSGDTDNPTLKQIFKLGFVDSFIGVNDKKSDPHRLRRLIVQPGWQPETLLAVTNKAVLATAVSGQKATHEDSAWFTSKGELVETSGHSNNSYGGKLSSVHNRSEDSLTYLHGTPGTEIFKPGRNRAENWILDASFRLDRGEFWIRQNSSEQGEEWRLGGNENHLNLQYRVAHGKYENLASSRLGIQPGVWHHLRLIKRGKGIVVNLDGHSLWNLPVHLQGRFNGDIALQVWSGNGEGALRLKDARISLFPDDIRWLKKVPHETDVQRLIQDVEQVSGVTTVTHVVLGNQLKPVPFDKDLFRIISHRYGWNFIPTVRLLAEKKPSLKHEGANSDYLWMSAIKTLVKQNKWTHVNLDLSKQATAMKPEGFVRLSELKMQLESLGCLLLITAKGRPNARRSIEPQQILKNSIQGSSVTMSNVRANAL
jgi:hypothetical protein